MTTEALERPQAAAFEWQDAMPNQEDDLELLLAKYARLQFVFQVARCSDPGLLKLTAKPERTCSLHASISLHSLTCQQLYTARRFEASGAKEPSVQHKSV